MQRLAEGVLTQIASLLNVDCAGILVLREGEHEGDNFSVLAGSGCYRQYTGSGSLDDELKNLVRQAFARRRHEFHPTRSLLYIRTGMGREIVVMVEAERHLSDTDRALIEVFCSKLSVAFENVLLYEQLQAANAGLEERVRARTSELTQANERLAAQWDRLRQANAFKREIIGTVAHDLKNPLGVVMGRSEMLKDVLDNAAASGDLAREQIRHIEDSGRRMLSMVDSLLADAMEDAMDISLRVEPIDLASLVRQVAEMSRPAATKKGQSLSVTAPEALTVEGDYDRLWEAIDNLVSNAVKYTPNGGRIEIRVEPEGTQARIAVADTGLGLMPEDAARLFGRFQRLSAKPTGGESSTGLGLSIAKKIVDLHGGRIAADSAGPHKGTTFSIALPLKQTMPDRSE
jgi:signal transduction histidine kinase